MKVKGRHYLKLEKRKFMSKYEISQRMLAQHPKILDALGKLRRCQHEFSNQSPLGAEFFSLSESQRMIILHIQGKLDWSKKPGQIANEFDFTPQYTRHLSNYLRHQEDISKVIGWDRLIELIVFVIQGRYGCSIGGFYDLFRKIKKRPRGQWSDIMDRVIREIQEGKRIKDIL